MPTTADYLNDLVAQKEALAEALTEAGVTVEEGETFSTLVPKNSEILAEAARLKQLMTKILNRESFDYHDDTVTDFTSAIFAGTTIKSLSLPECTSLGIYRGTSSGATHMGSFYGASSLTSVHLPKCKTINGHSVGSPVQSSLYGPFASCTSLTSISLPECTAIRGCYSFSGCSKLVSIDMPKLTTISDGATYVFASCTKLTDVNLPELTFAAKPGGWAHYKDFFNGCTALTTISLPKAQGIPYQCFYGCTKLQSVYAESATTIGYQAIPASVVTLYTPSCTAPIAESIKKVTSLTTLTLSMNPEDTIILYSRSIEGCSKLTTLMFEAAISCASGHNIALSSSPLNLESAKRIISKLVDYKGTDREYAQKVTFSSTTLALLEADGATAPGDITWTEYARSKGWNI